MKSFSTVWYILLTVLVLVVCVFAIIEYRKTKDEESISPEDLKQLKKSHLRMTLLIGAALILENIKWLTD
ncbi:MAG: hypothetical protein Q4G10_08525 [Bacteroidia bacterium]|nr:hypothetical protein [Bacteroidia bacterium]